MCGAVNLTAPNPVTNSEFTATLAKVLHRPAVRADPDVRAEDAVRQRDGRSAAARPVNACSPTALQRSGYEFQHETLDVALRAVLQTPSECDAQY